MKLKDLVERLKTYNQEADVDVTVNNKPMEFSLCYGGGDGCTRENADTVSFYVDELCSSEK